MEYEQVQSKVFDIVAKTLEKDISAINLASSFKEDLAADSLAIAELAMAFEDTFEVTIDEEHVEKIAKVEDAVKHIFDLTK